MKQILTNRKFNFLTSALILGSGVSAQYSPTPHNVHLAYLTKFRCSLRLCGFRHFIFVDINQYTDKNNLNLNFEFINIF